jgi:uncharacterized protein YndB with AHSA1/START domain
MPNIDDAVLPEHRELTLVRVYDAPRALVFKAFTDPVHLARWWGPHGFTTPICEFDARPGGALRIHMRAPDGRVHVTQGEVREIVIPERLVFVIALQEDDGSIRLENLTTVTLVERAGKTELTLHVRVVQATAAAAPNLAGMQVGWSQSLERLAELVAAL